MILCAIIGNDNKVKGIIQTEDSNEIQSLAGIYGQVIDISNLVPTPVIGWEWDGNQIVGTSESAKITKLAMRQRFTFDELIAITTAMATLIPLQVLLFNLQVATYIDLKLPDTAGGMALLVAYGLITQDRMNIILNTPPTITEIHTE